jgi:hypothetical protein
MGKAKKMTPLPKRQKVKIDQNRAASKLGESAGPAAKNGQSLQLPDLNHIAPDLRPLATPVESLELMADNPLDHSDDEIAETVDSLKRWGFLLPLVINTAKAPPVMVGGNKRLRAAMSLNMTHVPVVRRDMTDEEEKALAVTLNATQGAKWNKELLGKALHGIGSLKLGERMDELMSRLAEAKGLIPKNPPVPKEPTEPATPITMKCPACSHEWQFAAKSS